ncbi:MAG TPA: DUF4384 domain-containing protein [bacterium]|nr:DUF4384 domain-containing protein [bacterium]HMW31781.1 DUF4384 domain-containing protein [bacterium]HMY35717.1 DUF4384 domain-containing protein [bacterium]HMZ02927.1 DUF4384 domain-containing protein [bacterium]HNB08034.1 DUF4384 domain-containing protein [bacterium]
MYYLLIALVLLTKAVLAGDAPDWVIQPGKSAAFPASAYIVGYGSASAQNPDAQKIAEDNARAALSGSIVTDLRSTVISRLEEQGKNSAEYFSSVTQSSTGLQLLGISIETYKDKKLVHVLAYAKRTELSATYNKKREALISNIAAIITQAKAAEESKKIEDAAALYLSLFPMYEELREAEIVLTVVHRESQVSQPDKTIPSRTEIAQTIDRLLAQSITSVEDAARAVAYQVSKQISGTTGSFLVSPMTYQDSKMSSPFARYFQQALETQFQKYAVWEVARQARGFQPKSSQITRDLVIASGAGCIFEGNYWEQGDRIKLIGRLRDVQNGRIMAAVEVTLDIAHIQKTGLSIKPENMLKALADQKAFAEEEVISSDIQLDVWTNKGTENLLFAEGEIMKIYVRTNRAAHIRILYNFADGSRTLLYDDHYIDEAKANQVVEIPGEFECTGPFGAEMMVVVASVGKLPEVKTYSVDGIAYLDEKDAKKAAYGTRGFKKKDPASSTSPQQTEKKLTITTIAK